MFAEEGGALTPALLLFGARLEGSTLACEAFHVRRAFDGLMVEVEAEETTVQLEGRKTKHVSYSPKPGGLKFRNDSPETGLVWGRLELQLDLEEAR